MKTLLLVAVSVLLAALLLGVQAGRTQEESQDSGSVAAALLGDPAARGKMSAMLETKLLSRAGQMSELVFETQDLETAIAASTAPGDVLVNDPGSDFGLSTTQSETTIRLNPVTGTLCSAYNDSQHWYIGSIGFSGFSRSTDGGESFEDRGAIPRGGGGSSFGDPSLVWRRADEDFYYASLHSHGLGLWRSRDDCETFAFHGMIHTGAGDDKELMAVDNNPSSSYYGRFYVAWTDFYAGERIFLTHSDDGLTWSIPVALSDSGADVQGAWPAVAPNGDVYVAWVRWNPYYSGPIDIEVVRSVDGGASFEFVSNPMTGQVNPMDPVATLYCDRPALNADIRYLPSPQLEVGPDGCLHVVYSYDPDAAFSGDAVNVYYRRSCDGGAGWGPEIQLNDDGTLTDQWFPTVSVDGENRVAATWYDRRLDPTNNYLFDYYLRISADGGNTWVPSSRLSDVSSAVPTLIRNFDPVVRDCYHGDYDQQVQDPDFIYVQWSDDRNIKNGHPDPDVWFEKVPKCEMGSVEGTVTSGSGGAPIQGAEVSAEGAAAATGSDGFYQLTLCTGIHEVTASAFGYLGETRHGVAVVEGAVTVVDFALDTAPTWTLEGTVTDSATGWPLYAEVDYGPGSVWTAPETGYYQVDLPEDLYALEASAWVDGYLASTATVDLASDATQDFRLEVDSAVCAAPGYEGEHLVEDFEADDGGYTHAGTYDEWEWGTPTVWPYGCWSGSRCWCTDLDGDYEDDANQWLYSPVIDLSYLPLGTPVRASWYQAFWIEASWYDRAYAEVRIDGGPWQVMWSHSGYTTLKDWSQQSSDISAAAGGTVQFRWRLLTDYSVSYTGWCIDYVRVQGGSCTEPPDGGLVMGNAYDANLGDGIVGAIVSVDVGGAATTRATPGDPGVGDGFYTLYVPTGTHDLSVSADSGYGAVTETVLVADLGTVAQDFQLPAGMLSAIPDGVDLVVLVGGSETVPVVLDNGGGVDASFELVETDREPSSSPSPLPTGPFADRKPLEPSKELEAASTEGWEPAPAPPSSAIIDAGDVIQSWPAPLNADPWGIATSSDGTVWVGNGWSSEDRIYEHQPDGTPTGSSWPYTWPVYYGPADHAFNWNTGMLWSLDVGGDNCLHEMDPAGGYTSKTICGPWDTSQRGVAYDPSTDTWFVGGWYERIIYHINSAGMVLDSVYVALTIAGLAYNPDTQHLFVIENAFANDAIYVLDAANQYDLVGRFQIPLGAYSGAGLEIDCDGSLWAVDQKTDTVYQLESGERASSLCPKDVSWLSEFPTGGTVLANDQQAVSFVFDAGGLPVGEYLAWVLAENDTPYRISCPSDPWIEVQPDDSNGSFCIPVKMTVTDLVVDVDIKPGSCPNSWNRESNGVLPVAILGSEGPGGLDVTQIDVSSVRIRRADNAGGSVGPNEGPPGPHSGFEDVGTPFDGQECDCHEAEGDGILDLSMKFRTREVADLLPVDEPNGALVPLFVSGRLLDGRVFRSGSDCVRLVPPGSAPGRVTVQSVAGSWIDATPPDDNLDGGGFGSFQRTYPQSTVLTLTAPSGHDGNPFVGWRLDEGELIQSRAMTFVVDDAGHTARAVFKRASGCGLGFELVLLLPPLIWFYGRRRRRMP